MDREGRDYWIKPLRDVGAIEPLTLIKGHKEFVPGHVVPKSPNSAYRLAADFVEVLCEEDDRLGDHIELWISDYSVRCRLSLQAEAAARSASEFVNSHGALVKSIIKYYVPKFLPDYALIYTDVSDGDRITSEEHERLASVGMQLTLADAFPDVILVNRHKRLAWFVEAVTSDGEVDLHKFHQLKELCERSGLELAGLTTAYESYKDFAKRQSKYKNVVPQTFVWILERPATVLLLLSPEGMHQFRG